MRWCLRTGETDRRGKCAAPAHRAKMREDYNGVIPRRRQWSNTKVGEMSFEQFAECIQIP